MANRKPEQDLIEAFVNALQTHPSNEIRIATVLNKNCKSKTFADVEYRSVTGIHWVIEAKSHDSGDRHNTVHKMFGELLKETGRTNRADCKHALLIPEDGIAFYRRAFQSIDRSKFIAFGQLIPVDTVFTFGLSGVGQIAWVDIYDSYEPK